MEPRKKAPPWRKTRTGSLASVLRDPSSRKQDDGSLMEKFRQSSDCCSSAGRVEVGRGMLDASVGTLCQGWMLEGPGMVASKVFAVKRGLGFRDDRGWARAKRWGRSP